MASPTADSERVRPFAWSESAEPHVARRRALLAAHPDIKSLYGPCPKTKYVCTALVALQLFAAYLLRDAPWLVVVLAAYAFGGLVNQTLVLAIHELSHNLAFDRPWRNRLFAVFVNLPIGVPVAETFRHYHLLHHVHQGHERFDTDLPTDFERRFVQGRLAKLVWLAFQGFAYALRPLFVHPKRPSAAELANFAVVLAVDLAILHLWGLKALVYLPLGSLLVMGLHPIAGHFISEHYVFRDGQETYSYYGPLNRVAFNVGYHNEHHDFPYVAGSRLPELRRLAPEFYESLHQHRSWTRTLVDFVMRPELGGHSRVKRRGRGSETSSP